MHYLRLRTRINTLAGICLIPITTLNIRRLPTINSDKLIKLLPNTKLISTLLNIV
jgi:hypothetical protein